MLYAAGMRGDTFETLVLSIAAAGVAAAMSVKQDADNVLWGIFHRTWVTHSLTTVFLATGLTYILLEEVAHAGPLSTYVALAVLAATLSHVLLDSLTRGGVPMFGPFDDTRRGLRWFKGDNILLNWAFFAAGIAMAAYYFGLIRL